MSEPDTFIAWTGFLLIGLGTLLFLIWGIVGYFIKYDTRYELDPDGRMDIIFKLPLWKNFVVLIPPDIGDLEAQIRYRFEDENGWQWQSPTSAAPMNRDEIKTVMVWRQDAENRLFKVDEISTPLPTRFILSVRLLRRADRKCMAEFDLGYGQASVPGEPKLNL